MPLLRLPWFPTGSLFASRLLLLHRRVPSGRRRGVAVFSAQHRGLDAPGRRALRVYSACPRSFLNRCLHLLPNAGSLQPLFLPIFSTALSSTPLLTLDNFSCSIFKFTLSCVTSILKSSPLSEFLFRLCFSVQTFPSDSSLHLLFLC